VAEVDPADLPRLFPGGGEAAGFAIAATGKKGEWIRVIYDEAGREGWVRMKNSWEHSPWRLFLMGKRVYLLPRLKETACLLRQEPLEKGAVLGVLSPAEPLLVADVEGDWIKVETGQGSSGYLRWREGDGRITITIQPEGRLSLR
jgi:hypothetical protein